MKHEPEYRNSRFILNMLAAGLILALAILPGFAQPAVAADPAFEFVLPAGLACDDFDLKITGWGEGSQVYKEFVDKNGNLRTISAGTGFELVYTRLNANQEPVATFSTKSNGAVQQTTVNPDGSSTLTLLGHNVVFLFPTDVPAGPSTTLYVGRVVFTIDPSGVWTLQEVAGREIDICAALSQ